MKIDERLHDAMHDYADAIEPEPGSWSKIAARFDDEPLSPVRPSRRPLVLAGVACAVVIVLAVSLVIVNTDDDGARVTTGPNGGSGALPSRILAINPNGQPVVLDATTGEQHAELGSTIAEGTQIAVSPDGQDAYMVTGDGNEGCADHSVDRLPVGDAPQRAEQIALEATSPTLSPDGRYLAYLRCLPGDARPDEIVLRDLTTRTERTTPAPAGTFFANRLEFAADSRHVVFDLFADATGRATFHEIDLVGREAPPGRTLPVDPGTSFVFGRLGATGALLAQEAQQSPARVVALRPDSDPASRTLFTIPEPAEVLESDESGRHILAVLDRTLYRWSEGDNDLTKIADGVTNAAWIPDPRATEPPVVSTNLPNGVLVARKSDQQLAVLGANGGEQHSLLARVPGVSSLAAIPPDGLRAVYGTTSRAGPCGVPRAEVGTVDPDTGTPARIVSGATSPIVSPDGRFVAYGIQCDGVTLGFSDLRDGRNYRIDPFPPNAKVPGLRGIDPIAWAPDSERILYRAVFEGSEDPTYWVGRLWPLRDDTGGVRLPDRTRFSVATFVDNARLAVAADDHGRSRVRFVDLRFQPAAGEGFEVPGRIERLVLDPSGTHFLAVTVDGRLSRWSEGDAEPTKLADDILAASWIPWS